MVSEPTEAVVEVEAPAVGETCGGCGGDDAGAGGAGLVAAPVQEVPVVRAEAVVSLFSLFSPVERALHRLSRTTSFNAGWVEMGGLEETGVSVACRDSVETEAQTLQRDNAAWCAQPGGPGGDGGAGGHGGGGGGGCGGASFGLFLWSRHPIGSVEVGESLWSRWFRWAWGLGRTFLGNSGIAGTTGVFADTNF